MGPIPNSSAAQSTTPLGADLRHVERCRFPAVGLLQANGDEATHLLQLQAIEALVPLEEAQGLADDLVFRRELAVLHLLTDEMIQLGG